MKLKASNWPAEARDNLGEEVDWSNWRLRVYRHSASRLSGEKEGREEKCVFDLKMLKQMSIWEWRG